MTFDPNDRLSLEAIEEAWARFCADARENSHQVHISRADFERVYRWTNGQLSHCDFSALERRLLGDFTRETDRDPVPSYPWDGTQSGRIQHRPLDIGPGYPVNMTYDTGRRPVEYEDTVRAGELRACAEPVRFPERSDPGPLDPEAEQAQRMVASFYERFPQFGDWLEWTRQRKGPDGPPDWPPRGQ